jgi:raffinose/stachyose/melibiose transport system permease protein
VKTNSVRGWRPDSPAQAALVAGLLVMAAVWLIPFLFVAITAIRSQGDLTTNGVFSIPRELRLENFPNAWRIGDFSIYFRNSAMLVLVKVPLGLLLAALAAYPLAKMRFRFSTPIFIFFLFGLAIPVHVTLLPLFLLLKDMGIRNSTWALIPPYVVFGLPFQIFVMRGFFRTIPGDLLDAARLDGASELGCFARIMIPLSLPVLATLAIIDMLATWNELLVSLVLISAEAERTVPVGLLNFRGEFSQSQTQLSAAILIVILPVLILYVLTQRYLLSGLTAGALKE